MEEPNHKESNHEEPNHEDSDKEAIEILRKCGCIVSERGIIQIIEKPSEPSVALFHWKNISQIHQIADWTHIISVESYDTRIKRLHIKLKNKDDVPIAYKFLTDKFIVYAMSAPPK